jgi:hypothetical protein
LASLAFQLQPAAIDAQNALIGSRYQLKSQTTIGFHAVQLLFYFVVFVCDHKTSITIHEFVILSISG